MPFHSDIKIMTVIYAKKSEKNNLLYLTKGSVESVLRSCIGYVGGNGVFIPINPGNFSALNYRISKECK